MTIPSYASTLALLLAMAGVCQDARAQSTSRPRGIYCSCPPTNARSSSFIASVAARPFVDGFLVRIAWSDIEAAPGVYDWSLLDQQIALIGQAGKRIALAIVQGPGTPTWLSSVGVATITWSFQGTPTTTAIPWDPIYLQRWTSFIQELGQRYATDTTIALIHATHATQNGFEMQLPFREEAAYTAVGYTDAVYAQSWEQVLDAFLQAFPSHPVDVDVHPIWGSDAVATQVVRHGTSYAPQRFGAFGGWWNVHNATQIYPGMQSIFEQSAHTTFTNVQNVGSFSTTPTRYNSDPEVYAAAYELGLDTGIRYFEVWNADLLDPSLEPLLSSVATELHCNGWYQFYPDPEAPPAVVHRVIGCTAPGTSLSLTITGGPVSAAAVIAVGTQRAQLPIGTETLLIDPAPGLVLFPPLTLDSSGQAAWPVSLPPELPFAPLMSQAVVLTTGGQLILTNAYEIR